MTYHIAKKTLSREAAKKLVDFAIAKAVELGVCGAIAVVDDGGHLICAERIDGTMFSASSIAIGKAATAVGFRRPGIVLEKTASVERIAMQTLGNVTPFPFVPLMGALPIEINGEIVGGISVAGAGSGANDETIAHHAIEKYLRVLNRVVS
jgi:glc operon protein GlcG